MNAIVDFLTEGTVTGELLAELAGVIADIPEVPSQIADLGLYTAHGMFGTTLKFDIAANGLSLVPVSDRGTDARKTVAGTRGIIHFEAVRLAEEARVAADDALNLRALGVNAPATAKQLLTQKLTIATGNVRATREYQMLGGIKGEIRDHDGVVLTDLYNKLGVAKPATAYFELDKASPKMGDIRRQCSNILRATKAAMAGTPFKGVYAFVGSDYWDGLVDHKEVRETYLAQVAAAELRGQTYGKVFSYGGITFAEYTGSVGDVDLIASDEARFFPIGSDAFQMWFASHDRNKDGAELGQVEYALPHVDPKGRYVEVEIQSNPATLCTRPGALIEGRAGGAA